MSENSDEQFLLNISKQNFIDILEKPQKLTEIDELNSYISKISAVDIGICLKFLKKDAVGVRKFTKL